MSRSEGIERGSDDTVVKRFNGLVLWHWIAFSLKSAVMDTSTMPAVAELVAEPYASVVCYPRARKAELKRRMKELERMGISALEFVGGKQAFNLRVLGKGCVGIVVLAHKNRHVIALKIRRVDADRTRMQDEAKLLKKANSVQVGPRLLGVSRNFLCMQFIDGELLPRWLNGKRSKARIGNVLREILEQCWRLDKVNLDHGELSHAPKHIIVDKEDKSFIVDFESASLGRRPSNVTSICQFLFIGSETAEKIAEKLGATDRKAITEALKRYKKEKTRENFCKVLDVCAL
jgi:putative serine/threonine protein kinase